MIPFGEYKQNPFTSTVYSNISLCHYPCGKKGIHLSARVWPTVCPSGLCRPLIDGLRLPNIFAIVVSNNIRMYGRFLCLRWQECWNPLKFATASVSAKISSMLMLLHECYFIHFNGTVWCCFVKYEDICSRVRMVGWIAVVSLLAGLHILGLCCRCVRSCYCLVACSFILHWVTQMLWFVKKCL